MIVTIDGRNPIAKLAAELPGAMALFESLGLDYACAGDRSLEDAAHAEGIVPDDVIAALRRLKHGENKPSWNDRPLCELTRYLVQQHHRFVRDELAHIALRLADVCSAPEGVPSYLVSLRIAFMKLAAIILPHLHQEEEEAFRTIEALEKAWQTSAPHSLGRASTPGEFRAASSSVSSEFRGTVAAASLGSTLRTLATEHGAIAAQLRIMRELRVRLADSDSLSPQCNSVLEDLVTLEAHLHEYIFLENCILFPRAAALAEQASADALVSG